MLASDCRDRSLCTAHGIEGPESDHLVSREFYETSSGSGRGICLKGMEESDMVSTLNLAKRSSRSRDSFRSALSAHVSNPFNELNNARVRHVCEDLYIPYAFAGDLGVHARSHAGINTYYPTKCPMTRGRGS